MQSTKVVAIMVITFFLLGGMTYIETGELILPKFYIGEFYGLTTLTLAISHFKEDKKLWLAHSFFAVLWVITGQFLVEIFFSSNELTAWFSSSIWRILRMVQLLFLLLSLVILFLQLQKKQAKIVWLFVLLLFPIAIYLGTDRIWLIYFSVLGAAAFVIQYFLLSKDKPVLHLLTGLGIMSLMSLCF